MKGPNGLGVPLMQDGLGCPSIRGAPRADKDGVDRGSSRPETSVAPCCHAISCPILGRPRSATQNPDWPSNRPNRTGFASANRPDWQAVPKASHAILRVDAVLRRRRLSSVRERAARIRFCSPPESPHRLGPSRCWGAVARGGSSSSEMQEPVTRAEPRLPPRLRAPLPPAACPRGRASWTR